MKSIYKDGFIIEGVEETTVIGLLWVNKNHYKKIPVTGSHSFTDGQEVVEGVDYRKVKMIYTGFNKEWKTVATQIKNIQA